MIDGRMRRQGMNM